MRRVAENPDGVSRAMFVEEIQRAYESMGTYLQVADAIGTDERRIYAWLKGRGPSYPKMVSFYFKLKKL